MSYYHYRFRSTLPIPWRGTSEKLEPREREDLLFCNLEEREKYFA